MLKSILVVDDDLDVAERIKHIVEAYDHNCKCAIASEPYEALLALSEKRFDFVLLDQQLPGLNGTSVLREMDQYIDADPLLNDNPTYLKPLPVAIMSGGDQPNVLDKMKLKHFQMVKFIRKRNLSSFLSQTFA